MNISISKAHQSVHPPAEVGLPEDAPVKSTKRQLDETEHSAAKRPYLSADKTTILQHPKPKPPHAAFLKRFVDPSSSLHSFVSEWLQSVGSDRNVRCRSDSYISQLASEPIQRQLVKSAPQIEHTRDFDGFTMPPTSVPTRSQSQADIDCVPTRLTPSLSRASGKSLVEDPFYRERNLAMNNIYIRHPCDPMPEKIAGLIDRIRRGRDSPGPSLDQVIQDRSLYNLSMGATESQVQAYFQNHIFPDPKPSDSLKLVPKLPLASHAVPNAGFSCKVSNPVPGMLYGYSCYNAFPLQQAQLHNIGREIFANSQSLVYPFFVIEFKGDGPSGAGSLWVATNQCLGGAVPCVNMVERLNDRLEHCMSDRPINSVAFSIAMNGTEARLYIAWKHDRLTYYTANINNFLLSGPDHYLEFRKYVHNIIDWGRDERRAEIRSSLDTLLEASKAAKA